MRTLSLGVLIVCGGTLAALPFRRYQIIPDASAVPTQVTGPSQSALNAPPADGSNTNTNRFPSLADFKSLDGLRSPNDSLGFAPSQAVVTRRHLDIPLTYDDLAVPLDQPKPVRERYSATAAVQQQKLEQDRIAALVMPPMESLPIAQQQELIRVAETIGTPEGEPKAHASGRLASTLGQDRAGHGSAARLESLPQPQEVDRQRFWIRQPD